MQELSTPAQTAQWLHQRVRGRLLSDSRQIAAGDGFLAWPGAAVDARHFVAQALQRGAAACLVERSGLAAFGLQGDNIGTYSGLKAATGAIAAEFFGQPSHALQVLAVTGTNGKTSTAWWLAQALSALAPPHTLPCGMIGTLGVGRVGSEFSATGLTTPDPVLLQQTLRRFVDEGLRACAIEASSIGIEEHRLNGTRMHMAIFTNLTQDHLDYHGSMAAYSQAKRRLFSWPGLQCAVVNVDDSQGSELTQALNASNVDLWTVSCQRAARLRARAIAYDANGVRFEVVEGAQSQPLHANTVGHHNVSNLLGVLGAMRALGVPLQLAAQACSSLQSVPGRMEFQGGVDTPLVVVDYAHTPDALGKALTALRPLVTQRRGRLWCVFGCGGNRDAIKRPLMGAIASQKADWVQITSDNPRDEKPEAIIAQILLGLSPSKSVDVQVDRAQAIADTIARANTNDVVLIAGKGHEETQEIAGVKLPFSDREHAAKALHARSQNMKLQA